MGATPLNPESRLLADLERQRQRLGLDPTAEFQVLPAAPILLVGAQLSAALRPFARDLATKLGPPGTSDEDLERAAEALLMAHPDLVTERMEVESRVGITASPEGFLQFNGSLLPRDGLAAPLRRGWLRPRAPHMVALPGPTNSGLLRMESLQLALIHHPVAPSTPARGLRCQNTERILSLQGDGDLSTIDRDHEDMAALWQLVEDITHNGAAKILLCNSRDVLLKGLLDWMNHAG